MKMSYKTKMRKNAGSMITVVPAGLVQLLNFKQGDSLVWNVDIEKNEAHIFIEPIQEEE
jgi:antitoxin component of MazEF toxin-antitoxin module